MISVFGLLLVFPTFAFVPHSFFVLPLLYLIVFRKLEVSNALFDLRRVDYNLILIVLLVFFSFIYRIIFAEEITDYFPYTALIILTYIYSKQINKDDLRTIIYFVAIESIVAIIEFSLGIQSVFPTLQSKIELATAGTDSSLLYNNRVYGLSSNSSVLANKIFISLVLVYYLKLRTKLFYIIQLVLLITLFLTFNRTVFVILLLFVFLLSLKHVWLILVDYFRFKFKTHYTYPLLVSIFCGIFGFVFLLFYFDVVLEQFTRSKGLNLSGRGSIWADFFSFIESNFWFGNGTLKYFVNHHGGQAHAHNSFLQLLANNGFLLGGLYLFLIGVNITKGNIIFIITLLGYSMFQYGVFWGVSLMDIVLFMFLFRNRGELISHKIT